MGLEGEVRGRFKCCGVVGLSEREVVGKNIHARVTSVIPGRSIGAARDCRLASMWPQQPRVNVIALSLTTFHQHNHQVLHRVSGLQNIPNPCLASILAGVCPDAHEQHGPSRRASGAEV
jgi:hypothetical protein